MNFYLALPYAASLPLLTLFLHSGRCGVSLRECLSVCLSVGACETVLSRGKG